MNKYSEKARELFKEGYNCSQSVFLPFAEEMGFDRKTSLMLSSSFGGGMGRLREVCGAVTGMFMVAGLKYGYSSPKDYEAKKEHYERIQELASEFKDKNGHIVCRELLGLGEGASQPSPEKRTDAYYKKRPCELLVEDAAEIISEYIKRRENKMKIAVAAMGNEVAQHFGHCESFYLFECEGNKIVSEESIPNPGHKPGFLPNFLADKEASVIIAGGMGGGAVDIFEERGVKVVTGASGDVKTAVQAYLDGKLTSNGAVCQEHQHAGECH